MDKALWILPPKPLLSLPILLQFHCQHPSPYHQHGCTTWHSYLPAGLSVFTLLLWWSIHHPVARENLSKCTLGGFPGGYVHKESTCNAGDPGVIPGLGRSPGEGNSNPLQFSCLENPTDRGAWWLQSVGSQRVRHNLATKAHHQHHNLLF